MKKMRVNAVCECGICNVECGLRSWLFPKGEVPLTNGRKSN